MVQRRIRAARFPAVKSLDTFDFLAIPSVNQALVMELARCEYIERRENVIAIGNSGTGKTHVALGLGLAACQRGMSVGFTTAAALVHELMEARDERACSTSSGNWPASGCSSSTSWASCPCPPPARNSSSRSSASATNGAPSWSPPTCRRVDRRLRIRTANRRALLDRLTHHVHILEMNGDSYRLKGSRQSAAAPSPAPDRADAV